VRRLAPQKTQGQVQTESISTVQDQLKRKHQKTTDRQLIQMMLDQCFYFSLMTVPFTVSIIYTTLRMNLMVDALQLAKDNMLLLIVGLMSSTCACTTFYCFTLSSQLFRHQLMHLCKCCQRSN
jgi:hypothetical protein